jgi:hypothetical protein
MTTKLLVAALATTALFAACGGEKPASSGANGSAGGDPKKAMLAYAKCMREHGVDMPDPQFEGNRVMQKGPKNVNQAKMRTADKACASIRDSVKPPELSDEKKAEFKQAALANAKCMREQGIDFPDPTFDENGGAQIEMKKGSGFNPESAKFKAAEKKCRDTLPKDVQTDENDG